jgi:tRNA dimethylallyltransferase
MLSDTLAEELSRSCGEWLTTLVVDSMQVYKEIPILTNQARKRSAELVSVVSVGEEWTVADHRQRASEVISSLPEGLPFVLDSGTGMYLNAILLEIPFAPKVSREIRTRAEQMVTLAENPRRAAREMELSMIGAQGRGSIWDGEPRYEISLLYLRPARLDTDRNINARSSVIAREGEQEAEKLAESGIILNRSVREAIGVREMLRFVTGQISRQEAEEVIAARTRRLARRQIRWFDKLVRSLPEKTKVLTAEDAKDPHVKHLIHDIIDTW